MAKVDDQILFTGTYGDICFYQVAGATFARKKSSLTRTRVLKADEFKETRKYAGDFGTASRIASDVYKTLPADIKGRWIFRAIAGDAASMLYKRKSEAEVKDFLQKKYIKDIYREKQEESISSTASHSTQKANLQWQQIFLDRWVQQGKPVRYFKKAWQYKKRFNPGTIPRRPEYFLGLDRWLNSYSGK
ncbi:MAG: hypothetical protein ABI480_13395 [Chitinophagaceae bacterium]